MTRLSVPLVPTSAVSFTHDWHNMALADSDPVSLIRPEDRVDGDQTPGMIRAQALVTDDMWAGLVKTGPHIVSGWNDSHEPSSLKFHLAW
jgi:hypothetical protein